MSIDERWLRNVDLNLLLSFVVLMEERSVSRAAQRMSIGQPGMSGALGRLRELVGDDLLVRVGRRLEPTPRALALVEPVQAALENLQSVLRDEGGFDPKSYEGAFHIGMPDDHEISFFCHLVTRMAEDAPKAQLVCRHADGSTILDQLGSADIDVAVSVFETAPPWVVQVPLFQLDYATLFCPEQVKLRGSISLAAYCRLPYVLVSFKGDRVGTMDAALAEVGRTRRVQYAVPRFSGLPFVVMQAPVLATLPRMIAQRFVDTFGLAMSPVPVPVPSRTVSLVYRRRDEKDPRMGWFRNVVEDVVKAQVAACLPRSGRRKPGAK